jgi:hypothetical protein
LDGVEALCPQLVFTALERKRATFLAGARGTDNFVLVDVDNSLDAK